MELIVYYDEQYPTVWVPRDISQKIASFLTGKKKFEEYNAESLKAWMQKSIEEDTCSQSVIVFSQDVVPDTVCHTAGPSSLIREYLDCGGRIVWIGNIPFFYFGENRIKYAKAHPSSAAKRWDYIEDGNVSKTSSIVNEDRDHNIFFRWGSGGCFSILGVMPLYLDFPASQVTFVKKGKSFGLQNPWYSIRPILIKGSNLGNNKSLILAKTKPMSLKSTKKTIFSARVRSLNEVKEREITLPSLEVSSRLFGPILTLISALIAFIPGLGRFTIVPSIVWFLIGGGLLISIPVLWFFRWRERFVSAWFKNFDKDHPLSGFIRIWDFKLNRITVTMLEELFDVALYGYKDNIKSMKPKEKKE